MAQRSRNELKTKFQTGDKPTEADFVDLLDSMHVKGTDEYPPGEQGPPGDQGAPGSQIISGTDDPINAIGRNGDYYINLTAKTFFGPKASGVWPSGFSIIGPSGAAGGNGADGKTILNGVGAPSNALGNNGDFYYDTNVARFYGPKTSGAWGSGISLVGPSGTNGTNGTNGNTVLNGTGVPSNSLGVNGDFYINTANNQIYGPKAGGTWPAGVSLVGPTGAQGPTGNSAIFQLSAVTSVGAVTTEQTLATFTVAASNLRNGSVIETFFAWLLTNSTNGKNLRLYINGTLVIDANLAGATNTRTFDGVYRCRYNGASLRMSTSINSSANAGGVFGGISGVAAISPDGNNNFVFAIAGQKASAGEVLTLENAYAKLVY